MAETKLNFNTSFEFGEDDFLDRFDFSTPERIDNMDIYPSYNLGYVEIVFIDGKEMDNITFDLSVNSDVDFNKQLYSTYFNIISILRKEIMKYVDITDIAMKKLKDRIDLVRKEPKDANLHSVDYIFVDQLEEGYNYIKQHDITEDNIFTKDYIYFNIYNTIVKTYFYLNDIIDIRDPELFELDGIIIYTM